MQEMFKGWEMPKKRPSLGVAMVGDQQFVLIPASASTPCMAKQVRSPSICFTVFLLPGCVRGSSQGSPSQVGCCCVSQCFWHVCSAACGNHALF